MASPPPTDDSIRSILVPTDGSPAAEEALVRALAIAEGVPEGVDAPTVHVLAVADTTDAPFRFDSTLVSELEELKRRLVEDIASAYEDHDVDVSGAIRRGRPSREIDRYAEDHDIDLIVLGRTGQTGVGRLLGSTADRVVRTASVPVVVVPGPNDDVDVDEA
ncbi:universal stress protein [Natrarchaeobius chitinivorans]|uniref:Universal stress protein n=1 Tax=Natrarchaeobius chitinivorans TaxID=1679083 RepID=A0A3N6MIN4_NATCH|nr:universal stress protein [Natrarchaeobius chitinivorans]RQG95551.1 universal stress protein [Natrarchaeobius chitinivorans]